MEKKLYGTVLIKAASILDVLADGRGKTIQKIAQETNLNPPTVLKILETLTYINYVSRDQAKLFYLGSRFKKYSFSDGDSEAFISIVQPHLEALQNKIDETIHLSMPQEDEVVYVNKLEPKNQSIYMTSKVGMKRSLYSSGMGKAVLSTFAEAQLDDYLAKTELLAKTPYTITDEAILRRELSQIQTQGFAVDDEEQELDCYCIATTIETAHKVLGAMSVSLPKFRLRGNYQKNIIEELLQTKRNIESIFN